MIKLGPNMDLNAYLAKPEGEIKGAVIVIHEVWGLDDHIKSVAERVAMEGYLALAPDLLGNAQIDIDKLRALQIDLFDPAKRNKVQPELRQLMSPIHSPEFAISTIDNTKLCFDYLYNINEVNQSVACMGFCLGGTYSFALAVEEPKLKVAIPFYGHADYLVDKLKNIDCSIFAFYGEQDERLMLGLDDLKQRMSLAKVDFNYKVYKDCGHAFFNDTNKFAYNEEAAMDAWNTTLNLLKENL